LDAKLRPPLKPPDAGPSFPRPYRGLHQSLTALMTPGRSGNDRRNRYRPLCDSGRVLSHFRYLCWGRAQHWLSAFRYFSSGQLCFSMLLNVPSGISPGGCGTLLAGLDGCWTGHNFFWANWNQPSAFRAAMMYCELPESLITPTVWLDQGYNTTPNQETEAKAFPLTTTSRHALLPGHNNVSRKNLHAYTPTRAIPRLPVRIKLFPIGVINVVSTYWPSLFVPSFVWHWSLWLASSIPPLFLPGRRGVLVQ